MIRALFCFTLCLFIAQHVAANASSDPVLPAIPPSLLMDMEWTQVGSDFIGPTAFQSLGQTVAIDGDGSVVAIASPALGNGVVQVYEEISNAWVQIGSDLSGQNSGDQFGYALDLSDDGTILAIGARWNDANGTRAGHVRVYENVSGTWQQIGSDIEGDAAEDNLGTSVSLSGDGLTLACGAPGNDAGGTGAGAVKIYRNFGADIWSPLASPILGQAASDQCGASLSLNQNGSTVVVGSPNHDTPATGGGPEGHVRVFIYNVFGSWDQIGLNIDGSYGSEGFGSSVAFSGDGAYVAVGAPDYGGFSAYGRVAVFEYDGPSWIQVGSDFIGTTNFEKVGYQVDLSFDGQILALSAPEPAISNAIPGDIRVYSNNAGTWELVAPEIEGDALNDRLGLAMRMSGDGQRIIAGDPNYPTTGNFYGQAKVYQLSEAAVIFPDQDPLPDLEAECSLETLTAPTATDQFGAAITGTTDVVLPISDVGTTVITWTYDDGMGNILTQNQNAIITDTDPPVPDAGSLLSFESECSVDVLSEPSATDACGGPVTVSNDATLPITALGLNVITWSYTDEAGNVSQQSQEISIVDNSPPLTTLATLPDIEGTCEVTTLPDPEVIDNCSGTVVITNDAVLPITTIGTTTVTWTLEDEAGNQSTAEQSVVVSLPVSGLWEQAGLDITGSNSQEALGRSVALNEDGSVMAVGIYSSNFAASDPGSVQVYMYVEPNWIPHGLPVTGDADDDEFGAAVSLNATGDVLAVGAPKGNGFGNSGYARIYAFDGSDWNQIGADIDGDFSGDQLGSSVSLDDSGTKVAIGLPEADVPATNAGKVKVFEDVGDLWVQLGPDINGLAENDNFGSSAALNGDGNVVVVGAPGNDANGSQAGMAQAFLWNGLDWQQLGQNLEGPSAGDAFGEAVAIDELGARIVVGAPLSESPFFAEGVAIAYDFDGLNWTQVGGSVSGSGSSDNLGSSLSMSSDGARYCVGSPTAAGLESSAGEFRIVEFDGASWVDITAAFDGDATADAMGSAVAMSGDGLFVAGAAFGADQPTFNAGLVRVFFTLDLDFITPDLPELPGISADCQVESINAPTATTPCGLLLTATTSSLFPITETGSTLVEWEFDDGLGNTLMQTQEVTISDLAPIPDQPSLPEVTDCPIQLSVPTASDACDGQLLATTSDPIILELPGTYVVTWTYTDSSGNTSTQIQLAVVPESCMLSTSCEGDLNLDGNVGTADMLILLGQFGSNCVCIADFDMSGDVGTADLLVILGVFGTSCE